MAREKFTSKERSLSDLSALLRFPLLLCRKLVLVIPLNFSKFTFTEHSSSIFSPRYSKGQTLRLGDSSLLLSCLIWNLFLNEIEADTRHTILSNFY